MAWRPPSGCTGLSLDPLAFILAIALVVYLGIAVFTGRRITIVLPQRFWRSLVAIAIVAVAANWTAKLIWLGM